MALNGIGGNGAGSALDKFQQIRDLAKKKIDGADNRTRLADLLKQKQSELGIAGGKLAGGPAAKSPMERMPSGTPDAGVSSPGAMALQDLRGPSAYGKAGGLEKTDPKPALGRYIDFMA